MVHVFNHIKKKKKISVPVKRFLKEHLKGQRDFDVIP